MFYDLFPEDEAAVLEMRSLLLMALARWLLSSDMAQAKAAKELGTTRSCISDIKHGKINRLSLGRLVRMAVRAGLRPEMKLAM